MSRLQLLAPNQDLSAFELSVRAIVKAGLEALQDFLSQPEDDDPSHIPGFNKEGRYESLSLDALCNLMSMLEQRNPLTIFYKCVAALQMSQCFTAAGFAVSEELECFILRLLDVGSVNGCTYAVVRELDSFPEQGTTSEAIGQHLSTTYSLLAHSCGPNCHSYTCGGHRVIVAAEPIREGSVITTAYACPFYYKRKKARRAYLMEHYLFYCKCDACEGNWPVFGRLPEGKCPDLKNKDASFIYLTYLK